MYRAPWDLDPHVSQAAPLAAGTSSQSPFLTHPPWMSRASSLNPRRLRARAISRSPFTLGRSLLAPGMAGLVNGSRDTKGDFFQDPQTHRRTEGNREVYCNRLPLAPFCIGSGGPVAPQSLATRLLVRPVSRSYHTWNRTITKTTVSL